MKKNLAIAVFLCTYYFCTGQSSPVLCDHNPSGNYDLRTQSDIDNFFTGSNVGCNTIIGTLTLADNSNGIEKITSLSPLLGITTIENLFIGSTDELLSLEGLETLTAVNDLFFISDNSKITDLSGLANLKNFGSLLHIVENPSLISLTGLENLESGGDVLILSNPQLSDCCSIFHMFENLNSFGSFIFDNSPSGNCNSVEDVFGRTFTGAEDKYWNNAANWSTGCGDLVPRTGLLVIDNYCETLGTQILTLSQKSKLTINIGATLNHNDPQDFELAGSLSLLGELNLNSKFINGSYLTNYGTLSGTGEYQGNLNNRSEISGSLTIRGNVNNSIGTIRIGE